jgi:hypothetical protein
MIDVAAQVPQQEIYHPETLVTAAIHPRGDYQAAIEALLLPNSLRQAPQECACQTTPAVLRSRKHEARRSRGSAADPAELAPSWLS